MSILNRNQQFANATPIIPRNRKYEKLRAPKKPRDITTQVRDWFHSRGLTEAWINPGAWTKWSFNGLPMLELSTTKEKTCKVRINARVRLAIGKSELINRMSHTMQIANAYDLHMVKPFIRLALEQSESEWLRDVNLIRERMTDHRMAVLQSIFAEGIRPNESVNCSNQSYPSARSVVSRSAG